MINKNVKEIFQELTGKSVRTYSFFDCGFSNNNYLINDSYVVRIPKDNRDETISFDKEHQIYNAIAPLNISEKIVSFNDQTGIKLSKFVHNTRKYLPTPTNEQILYVAKTLKKLHSSNIKVPFGYQMFLKMNTYKKDLELSKYINKDYERKVLKEVQKIFAKSEMVLCHNDLVKGNLLFKFNGVVFIDWEYGAMNNPFFDLASFVSENNLSEEQTEFFLSKYFGCKYNQIKRKRVDDFVKFEDILFYYWAYYLYNKRHDEIYLKIAKEKLARITIDMKKE